MADRGHVCWLRTEPNSLQMVDCCVISWVKADTIWRRSFAIDWPPQCYTTYCTPNRMQLRSQGCEAEGETSSPEGEGIVCIYQYRLVRYQYFNKNDDRKAETLEIPCQQWFNILQRKHRFRNIVIYGVHENICNREKLKMLTSSGVDGSYAHGWHKL